MFVGLAEWNLNVENPGLKEMEDADNHYLRFY